MAEEPEPLSPPNRDDVTSDNEKVIEVRDKTILKFDDTRSFTDELYKNKTSIVWGFNYGKQVFQQTEKNVEAYQKNFLMRHGILIDGSPSSDTSSCSVSTADTARPSTSKDVSDQTTSCSGSSADRSQPFPSQDVSDQTPSCSGSSADRSQPSPPQDVSDQTPSCSGSSTKISEPSTSQDVSDQRTPHSKKRTTSHAGMRKRARYSATYDAFISSRPRAIPSSLPVFTWANSTEIWQSMVAREEATFRTRNSRLFEDPCSFLPRARAIVVDWIMQVSDFYRLKRVTYYLAIDYMDRYLTVKPSIAKNNLQLIGISALCIAVKAEDMYCPFLADYADMCGGAYTCEEILECELLLINTLGWELNRTTPTEWLNLYMQLEWKFSNPNKTIVDESTDFIYPRYSEYQFVRGSHLMDLFSLDPTFLLFSYSEIAACAMYFLFGSEVAIGVSGLSWNDLQECAEYMTIFFMVIRDTEDPRLESIITRESREEKGGPLIEHDYTKQRYLIHFNYFEKAIVLKMQQMGFHVQTESEVSVLQPRKYIKAVYNPNPESPIVDIRRMSDSEWEMFTGGASSTLSKADTNFFDAKSKYTFDELLVGINEYISKRLLTRRMCKNVKKNPIN